MRATAFIIIILLTPMLAQAKTVVKVKDIPDPKEQLFFDIFKLAMSKSPNRENYEIEGQDLQVNELRMVEMLKKGDLDIIWAGIQESYEEELMPIRIPALKGLLGHRIMIIRRGDQARFDSVKTLDDLRQIPLGQGRFWGDTEILKHNGLNVVAPVKYESHVHMLEGGRFDGFPRGVHEPFSEVSAVPELNLDIEERLLLIYPYAMYFYTSQQNPELARDLERGFMAAIEDGSYDQLFYNHPMVKDVLGRANLQNRRAFRLENPILPKSVPVDDKRLWLNLDDL